jgi:hypothetical protein
MAWYLVKHRDNFAFTFIPHICKWLTVQELERGLFGPLLQKLTDLWWINQSNILPVHFGQLSPERPQLGRFNTRSAPLEFTHFTQIRGCIQKFPDWPPGARTANGIALCHYVQLYRYFVSQSSEFGRHNPLCCFSTSVYFCKHLFPYRLSPDTFGYTRGGWEFSLHHRVQNGSGAHSASYPMGTRVSYLGGKAAGV